MDIDAKLLYYLVYKPVYWITFCCLFIEDKLNKLFKTRDPLVYEAEQEGGSMYKSDMGRGTGQKRRLPSPDEVRVKVLKFPDHKLLEGDHTKHFSPFDQFYWILFGGALFAGNQINSNRIFINNKDADVLYENYKKFIVSYNPVDNVDMLATRQWEKQGPVVKSAVPKGYVFVEPDYIQF